MIQGRVEVTGSLEPSRLALEESTNRLLSKLGCPAISQAGGERISALDLVFEQRSLFAEAQDVSKIFNGNTLFGSFLLSTKIAQLWTDLRLDADGYISYYIPHNTLGSRQAGRIARALAEAETYRMTAMLAFPFAKSLSLPLRQAESGLVILSEKIAQLQSTAGIHIDEDGQFLADLSRIASKIEQWVSSYGLRFTASEA
ncbi:MAG: hypothetical protein CK528_08325 [Alcaligenaceae bacterium]|nr:MAG: hypothetical protein CK528_08325 [Alcaligenaceae bacterium]